MRAVVLYLYSEADLLEIYIAPELNDIEVARAKRTAKELELDLVSPAWEDLARFEDAQVLFVKTLEELEAEILRYFQNSSEEYEF